MDRVHVRALLVAATMIGIFAVSQAIVLTTPYEVHPIWDLNRPVILVSGSAWIIALYVLMIRQPTSELWKVVLAWQAAGAILALWYLPIEPRPLVGVPHFIIGDLWAAVFVHLIVVYPTGRITSRSDRRFVVAAYALAIGAPIAALIVEPEACRHVCGNPIAWFRSEAAAEALQVITIALIAIFMLGALRILVRHWRAAGPSGRRQISPMLVGAPLWMVLQFSAYFSDMFLDEAARGLTHNANLMTWIESLAIPVAILIGAIRASLARGNVADLVMELSRGIPVGSLQPVISRALRDPSLLLAFPAPSGSGYVDADGRPLHERPATQAWTPIVRDDGDVLAVLVHDPALLEEDPGLVEAVGSVAGMALENERLSAQVRAQLEEVRASRERIVEAADAERRRLERDLHDGAQQRLTALAIRLQTARSDVPEAAALLDEATLELQAAVGEVRDLARGVHPTILAELGLAAAVDALAERAPIPVDVDIPEGRLPDAIEATAYFVVAEALTNVARYAGASSAHVRASEVGHRLVVTVADDGRGGADPARGTGLRGLADRVAAARGLLDVISQPGAGTTVRVELPLS